MKKIIFLEGLPGVGKTTIANSIKNIGRTDVHVVDEIIKKDIINNVIDELERAIDRLKELGTFDDYSITSDEELVNDMEKSIGVTKEIDKNGRHVVSGEIIPNKGTWLEFELDARDVIYVRIDRTRKVPVTTMLRALGLSSDEAIKDVFGENRFIENTLEKSIVSKENYMNLTDYQK